MREEGGNWEEEALLRAVLQQNAESIFLARQRAERDLEATRAALEKRTIELAAALSVMQATLEATADGILATDRDGRVTVFNEKFLRMWGLTDAVTETGDHRRLLAAMATRLPDPADHLAKVERILAESPKESFDVLELADQRVFERYTRVQTVEGAVVGRVWSYRDVTDRAHALAALREAKTHAEAANRTKSAFLAMISHELRTPLNAIAGYAQILDLEIHGELSDQQRHALSRIQAGQRHLLTLIDEVLLHAKLETGTVHFQVTNVKASEAMAGAEALVAPQAWARQLTLAVRSCDPALMVRADPEKLHQILANLLSNAVKFSAAGGRIELSCTADAHIARFRVQDTGVGIEAKHLDAIFEPFVQVRSELTRTAEGTGLGLAISRTLARAMDGSLTVESEPGVGSAFTLSLPSV